MSEAERSLAALLELMARLRDPQHGCPWDRAQTFGTIAPYTIEEAYEVADAIGRCDREALRDELGDLLFQVVFHARLAEERGWFDFAAVATAIHAKLVRRHPHLFAGAAVTQQELSQAWEDYKAQERAARGAASGTVLAGVPRALPALTRAAKLGKRAARVGFDWPDAAQVREKVLEELNELDAALEAGGDAAAGPAAPASADAGNPNVGALTAELGDLLFSIVNWSRHLGLDAEQALRAANAKFERRFEHMEHLAGERGLELARLSAAEWDALWREAKTSEP